MAEYPRLLPVRQRLSSHPLADVAGAARAALGAALPQGTVRSGMRIGIAVGSRGIRNLAEIVRATVEALRERGAEPFIFPAMGSHAGATAEGQAQLLATAFGIDEARMGCPILSSMEVVELGRTPEHGLPVYVDEHQARADGLVAVNRVKAHTDFRGPVESGLMKMIAIGMGKRAQAENLHGYGVYGLKELMPEVARAKIRMARVLGGLAILEDGYHQTSEIVGLPADRIESEEPGLLARAKARMPLLPFECLDLLVVDRMGKLISGTGLDTNVIGRRRITGEPEWEVPRIEIVVVREMDRHAPENGVGIGLADFVTRRLADQIDLKKTQINGLTSTFVQRLMLPVVAEDDREAIDQALYVLRRKRPEEVRMVRIRDTARLDRLLVSEALRPEVAANDALEVEGALAPLQFDGRGRLVPDLVLPG